MHISKFWSHNLKKHKVNIIDTFFSNSQMESTKYATWKMQEIKCPNGMQQMQN